MLLAALLVWRPPTANADETLHVHVSVVPLKSIVESIGDEHVEVVSLVQPGHSPATYAPTPRQVTELARADLYIRIGVPFENAWMRRIRSVNPAMPILDAREGIELKTMHAHHHDGADDAHEAEAKAPC